MIYAQFSEIKVIAGTSKIPKNMNSFSLDHCGTQTDFQNNC